jgi:hypothetical protein
MKEINKAITIHSTSSVNFILNKSFETGILGICFIGGLVRVSSTISEKLTPKKLNLESC